jgi:hypothetical protein
MSVDELCRPADWVEMARAAVDKTTRNSRAYCAAETMIAERGLEARLVNPFFKTGRDRDLFESFEWYVGVRRRGRRPIQVPRALRPAMPAPASVAVAELVGGGA